jgi:hypothetical protein
MSKYGLAILKEGSVWTSLNLAYFEVRYIASATEFSVRCFITVYVCHTQNK